MNTKNKFLTIDFVSACSEKKLYPEDIGFEVAICGRSNSGKSGIINALANSKKLAKFAKANNCNYVAFGSFYKSKLKPKAKKADLKVLKWAKKNIKLPIVVIGGINDKNYKKLISAGAKYIAISSFIWDNPNLKPEIAIRKFK